MDGWIKLQRSIKDHWIWKDPIKLKWWIDILLSVNHSTTKVNIGNQIFECGRGQSIQSLSTWAKQWSISKDKARNFLVLLEKDGMISHENIGKTTRITICNYDAYQCDERQSSVYTESYTDLTPKTTRINNCKCDSYINDLHDEPTITQQQTHPNNKEKKERNNIIKKNNKKNEISDFSFMDENLKDIFLEWLEYRKTEFKATFKTEASLRKAYKRFMELSGGDQSKARVLVDGCIANGWKGLFPLDGKTGNKSVKQNQMLDFESAGSENNDGYKTTL